MANYLFINSLILLSFIFVGANITREIPSNFLSKAYIKILLGISGGLLGIVMIIYHYKVPGTTTTVDLRLLALMTINYIGGLTPTFISGIIILLFRTVYYGISLSSSVAVVQVCLSLLLFAIINKTCRKSFEKWMIMLLLIVAILISSCFYILNAVVDKNLIIIELSLAVICTGTIEYFLLQYVNTSNELYRKYKEDAKKDYLTGLYNRRSFDQQFTNKFERAKKYEERLSCMMIDIDYFKSVNDTYGHVSGDMVIKELASIISKKCRDVDIAGRVGGEEFCVLLSDCTSNISIEVGNRIRNAVRGHIFPISDGRFINITVSIGIATYPDTAQDIKSLKKEADEALYKAKQTGRDKVCFNIN